MELVALNCNHCGSKLKVTESAKFVTCKHCDTQLAIRHTDGASFTELAEAATRVEESAKQIERHADAMSEQTDVIVLQNELARIDRDWERERDGLMVKGKHGHQHVPTRTQATALYVGGPMFVLIAFGGYAATGSIGLLVLIGALGVFMTWMGASTMTKARAFEEAQARHEDARTALLKELDAASASRKSKKRDAPDDVDE